MPWFYLHTAERLFRYRAPSVEIRVSVEPKYVYGTRLLYHILRVRVKPRAQRNNVGSCCVEVIVRAEAIALTLLVYGPNWVTN